MSIDSVKNLLFQSNTNGKRIVTLVGIVLSVCSFTFNTGFTSLTSEYNPPHGVELGIWDANPDMEQYGGVTFIYSNNDLPLQSGDSSLNFISKERFQRYLSLLFCGINVIQKIKLVAFGPILTLQTIKKLCNGLIILCKFALDSCHVLLEVR